MLAEIEKLLVLQERDRKVRALRRELEQLPGQRREMEARRAATQGRVEEVKGRLKAIEVERKKLEVEAQAKRDAISRYRLQQFETRKNEEYQALGHEIARAEQAIREIEDRELEFMEEAERLKPAVAEAEAEAERMRKVADDQMADLDAKQAAIGAQVAALVEERAKLAEGCDEDLLDHYERLFAHKGDAVVPLEHDVCMGCHMRVTTQTAVRVKGGREMVSCEQCGRILYYGD